MILTKAELVSSLKHEVQILVHLAGKAERPMHDYRPTAKQRSALELLRYMSFMGPEVLKSARQGGFDLKAWSAAEAAAQARDFDQTMAVIAKQGDVYEQMLADVTDAEFRKEIQMFGTTRTLGSTIVDIILCGHAAYRTQLFLYLKSCGREELSTMNLWAGMDAPTPAPA